MPQWWDMQIVLIRLHRVIKVYWLLTEMWAWLYCLLCRRRYILILWFPLLVLLDASICSSCAHLSLCWYVRKRDCRPKKSTSELKTDFTGLVNGLNILLELWSDYTLTLMGPTVIDGVQNVCEMFLVIAIFFLFIPSGSHLFQDFYSSCSHFLTFIYLFIFVKIAFCVLVFLW